jgi:hypothetical protein
VVVATENYEADTAVHYVFQLTRAGKRLLAHQHKIKATLTGTISDGGGYYFTGLLERRSTHVTISR